MSSARSAGVRRDADHVGVRVWCRAADLVRRRRLRSHGENVNEVGGELGGEP
jgi:hypothetical protein